MLAASYLLLGVALQLDDKSSLRLLLALLSAGLLVAALWRRSPLTAPQMIAAVAATVLLLPRCDPVDGGALRTGLLGLLVAIGVVALLGLSVPRFAAGSGRWPLVALLAVYAAAGTAVVAFKPPPRIDVYVLEQGGAAALAKGVDPYSIAFQNPYSADETHAFFGDRRSELREYPYPPLSLLATAIGYLVGGDVRWVLLAAQLGTAAVLFAIARGAGHLPPVALGVAALHLLQLRGLHMLDQAWTDSMPALAFVVVVLLLQRGSKWLGPALGVFLAMKQYSVLALPILARDGRLPRRAWVTGLAFAAAVTLPFFLWSPRDFVDDVVLFQLRQPFRMDALSIPAYVAKATGWHAPGALALAGAVGATVVAWSRLGRESHEKGRRSSNPDALPLAAAVVYVWFFLCAKQAFTNYYYLVGVLVLGALALSTPGAKPASRSQSPSPA